MNGRTLRALVLATALSLVVITPAAAGDATPADYGRQNPTGLEGCPPATGVYDGIEKCFPVGWGIGFVHVVTDPIATNGWVTFWCQSQVGLQYRVGLFDLQPRTNYEIWVGPPGHPSHYYLGTVHTDRDGKGTVAGVLPLPEGHYYFLTYVKLDGSVIFDSSTDGQGFGVF